MRTPSLLLAFAAAASISPAAAQTRHRPRVATPHANTTKGQADSSTWEGTYTFQEVEGRSAGAGAFVEHTVVVRREGDELLADIDADGFQTSRSLRCTVKDEGDKLSLYFQAYREGNVTTPYREGQLLLTLVRSSTGGKARLLTYWGAYRPTLMSASSGRVYFRKTK